MSCTSNFGYASQMNGHESMFLEFLQLLLNYLGSPVGMGFRRSTRLLVGEILDRLLCGIIQSIHMVSETEYLSGEGLMERIMISSQEVSVDYRGLWLEVVI